MGLSKQWVSIHIYPQRVEHCRSPNSMKLQIATLMGENDAKAWDLEIPYIHTAPSQQKNRHVKRVILPLKNNTGLLKKPGSYNRSTHNTTIITYVHGTLWQLSGKQRPALDQ